MTTNNATVTVALNGETVTFDLDGAELSDDGDHRYLGNASRDFIADSVEAALLKLIGDAR